MSADDAPAGATKTAAEPTPEEVGAGELLHASKLEILKLLNAKRAAAGVLPLELAEGVSEAADRHCLEMVQNGTLSHWDLGGRKPYQRYFAAGCCHHVDERVGGDDAVEGNSFATDQETVLKKMTQLHEDFAQTGESARALAAGHTHVGIGVAISETHFRYVEVYVAQYVELDAESTAPLTGVDAQLTGKMRVPPGRDGNWGPVACVVYREPHPTPLSVDDLATLDAYEDFSENRAAVTWPWEMTFDPSDGSFTVPISFDEIESGQYYVMLYVRDDADAIPYDEMAEGLAIPGEGFVESTGIMINYTGDTMRRDAALPSGAAAIAGGAAGGAADMEAPIVDIVVVTDSSDPDLASKLQKDGYQSRTVGTQEGAAAAAGGLGVYFLRSRDPSAAPINGVTFVTGDAAELEAPEGYDVVPVPLGHIGADGEAAVDADVGEGKAAGADGGDALRGQREAAINALFEGDSPVTNGSLAETIWEREAVRSGLEAAGIDPAALRAFLEQDVDATSSASDLVAAFGDPSQSGVAPKAGKYTYLCVQHGALGDNYGALADLVLCMGDAREGRNALGTSTQAETLLLPVRGLSISFRRAQALVEPGLDGEDGTYDGYPLSPQVDEDEAAREAAFAQRAQEEEDRDATDDDFRRHEQRRDLIRLLREAEAENSAARARNHALDRQCAMYLHSLAIKKQVGDGKPGDGAQGSQGGQGVKKKSITELNKQYTSVLRSIGDTMTRLTRDQAQHDREALDLNGRLEEKEEKVESVREAFTNFKTEIAKAAENSRSGKPIPRKIIRQFEETELRKDEDVSKVRLRNINLKTQLRKLEGKLREKEQLADGLHLIDFEQLKIENQTLNEKIEERNEELHKLRKKTTTTVQVLTHIKEKLQFEKAQNEVLKKELATLDTELTAERDQLSKSKRIREKMRSEGVALQGEQGFVSNDSLVQDFERRKLALREKSAKVVQLRQKYQALMSSIDRDSMALSGMGQKS